MRTLWQDLRYAGRMLRKSPGFTAIALITLAIGIGANTIMFSVVNVLLFRPAQVKDPEQLALCEARNLAGAFPYSAYVDLRDDNPAFTGLMAHDPDLTFVTLGREDIARHAVAMFVSANYFSVLGVAPAQGRTFLPEEERQGAEPVVVLSHRAWQRQGADPGLVGTQVAINGRFFRVVGVAPERFTGAALIGPDLWLPLGSYGLVGQGPWAKPDDPASESWNYPRVTPVGRLKPGLIMSMAQTRLQVLAPRLKENYPTWWTTNGMLCLSHLPRLIPNCHGDDVSVRSGISIFLMSVSAVVLLIACLNLANMTIVQGAARHREIAIRLAIGGGRLRIVRQLLIESLQLAILGGALGLALAFWGTRLLSVWLGDLKLPFDLAGSLRIDLDVRVLAATLGFCLGATVLSGLRPALQLSRRDVVSDLKESDSGVLRSARRACRPRSLSVICQIALSVVLVMGAALFTRSALQTGAANSGLRFDGKLLVEVDPLVAGFNRAGSEQIYEALTDRLRAMPGVQTVSLSCSFPFAEGGDPAGSVKEYAPGGEDDASKNPPASEVMMYRVGVDYFESMGMPLLQGRSFDRLDNARDAEPVAVIDDRIARKLRPDGNALGCLIQFGLRSSSPPCRVVGIVPHLQTVSDDKADQAQIYVPVWLRLPVFIHLRTAGTSSARESALLRQIPAEIHKVDSHLPVVSVMTLADRYRNNPFVSATRMGARLAIGFGAMALFLASLGIYAVKGYMVASRTSEIGIRKALGATHRDVMGMVLREGMTLTLAGLFVGLLLGLAAARLIGSMLYGVSPIDPVSIVVAVALLGVASLLAGYIPARRAARVDPMVALRYE
jgi:predicted permease